MKVDAYRRQVRPKGGSSSRFARSKRRRKLEMRKKKTLVSAACPEVLQEKTQRLVQKYFRKNNSITRSSWRVRRILQEQKLHTQTTTRAETESGLHQHGHDSKGRWLPGLLRELLTPNASSLDTGNIRNVENRSNGLSAGILCMHIDQIGCVLHQYNRILVPRN